MFQESLILGQPTLQKAYREVTDQGTGSSTCPIPVPLPMPADPEGKGKRKMPFEGKKVSCFPNS